MNYINRIKDYFRRDREFVEDDSDIIPFNQLEQMGVFSEQPHYNIRTTPMSIPKQFDLNQSITLNLKEVSLLLKTDPLTVPDFTYSGTTYLARLASVYDGDTLRICFVNNGTVIRQKIRMYGYDSPELKPKNKDKSRTLKDIESEKRAANAAKVYLTNLLTDKLFRVYFGDFEKYGRILAIIYLISNKNRLITPSVNQMMINNGYGYPYEGGTKVPYEDNDE